jgi:hypothetical protein
MRHDINDAYVPERVSYERDDDLDALERSISHLSCMFGERNKSEMRPSPATMLTVVPVQLAEAA